MNFILRKNDLKMSIPEKFKKLATAVAVCGLLSGCVTNGSIRDNNPVRDTSDYNNTGILAIGGAIAGAVIQKAATDDISAAGPLVGGLIGGVIGYQMDKQQKALEDQLAPEIARHEAIVLRTGSNQIVVRTSASTGFDIDKSKIKSGFMSTLDRIGHVLKNFPDTHITIAGHTDSTGSEEHNKHLSLDRAESVARYFARIGVDPSRMKYVGYGESQPIKTNSTDYGRSLNRRVEITITADPRPTEQDDQTSLYQENLGKIANKFTEAKRESTTKSKFKV